MAKRLLFRGGTPRADAVTTFGHAADTAATEDPTMTDIATPPLSGPKAAPRRVGYWKFWGTLLWGAAILGVLIVVGGLAVFAGLTWLQPDADVPDDAMLRLLYSNGKLLLVMASAPFLCAFGVMALAVRLSGIPMRDYLGLVMPKGRDFAIGIAGLLLIYAAFVLLSVVAGPSGSPTFVIALYRRALEAGLIPALVVAVVGLAPVSEELLIRGFLLPGWAASWLGPTGAVVLTTIVWTAMHTQYNWIVLAQIACIGLLLGWLRQRSGSTLLTIFLHTAQNGTAMIQVAILERFS